jgi:hypothetical protein
MSAVFSIGRSPEAAMAAARSLRMLAHRFRDSNSQAFSRRYEKGRHIKPLDDRT